MNEVFIQLFVPSVLKTFDIKVSKSLRLYEIRDMLYELLSSEIDVNVLKNAIPFYVTRKAALFSILTYRLLNWR